jgi:hypothetical protein
MHHCCVLKRTTPNIPKVLKYNNLYISNYEKKCLNSDGQQFYKYPQNKQSPLNNDGQQFYKYPQNKQSPLNSDGQQNKQLPLNSDGQQFYKYPQNRQSPLNSDGQQNKESLNSDGQLSLFRGDCLFC